jgi:hypothetical protein
LTRCWTASELPSEKWRSKAFARWPASGANTSSSRLSSASAAARARSANSSPSSRLVHLGLDGLGVGAGLLAVKDAGADRDRVERELHRVLAGVLALAHEAQGGLVVDDEAVDGDAVTDRAHAGLAKWGRGFHVPPVGG